LALIEFEDVSYKMPNDVMALKHVNLKVSRGELVAIVGGNGAGKTTLLKHMNGLLKPASGTVRVDGRLITEFSVAQLSKLVGLVFQNSDHQLFAESVKEEIAFGLRNFGYQPSEVESRVQYAMRRFGLESLSERAPLTLSGGEKKRLCIALVTAWDPVVLALDEPTVGQDHLNKMRLLALVKKFIEERRTVIIVSHDLEFLWPLQPRTVVMAGGRVVADGPAASIFNNFALLESSGLRQPQLARLALALQSSTPFDNVDEAVSWLKQRYGSYHV